MNSGSSVEMATKRDTFLGMVPLEVPRALPLPLEIASDDILRVRDLQPNESL